MGPNYRRRNRRNLRRNRLRMRPRMRSRMQTRMRRKYKNKATKVVVKGPTVVPDRYFVRLKYVDYFNLGSAVSYVGYVFRGNSLFDPDYTATGHQPMGYDQLTQLYSNYIVFGSRITIKFMNLGTVPLRCYIIPSNLSSTFTDSLIPEETPYSKRAICTSINAGGVCSITNYMTTRKMFGVSKVQDFMDNFYSATSTNPVNTWYWQVFIQSTNGSLGTNMVSLDVQLQYYCEFDNKVMLSAS